MAKRKRRKVKKIKWSKPLAVFVAILLIAAIVFGYFLWKKGYLDAYLDGHDHNENGNMEDIVTADLSIHFPMLGNKYSGDCTLIKVGDTEVLIDAGSRKSSAETIKEYVDQYCTDGVLEYVIATHADQDHIAGFVGSKSGSTRNGIFYQYEIETLIQFARTEKESALYGEYLESVEYLETNGTTVYTALECWKEENGAKKSYFLDSESKISMNILYNYFYENKSFGGGGENEYSVCMLLSQGNNHYLFTGDLEAKGEEFLVQYNNLPKCKFFKAGHHGSPTSSGENLLSVIQPEIVCVCCCCGTTEYTENMDNVFPSQEFTDRVSKYTDKVYVTTLYSDTAEKNFVPMNGNIVLSSSGGEINVTCSNNNTVFKDTEWFKEYRTWTGGN